MLKKVADNKDIDKVIDELIFQQLIPHTCQLFENIDGKGLQPFASSVLVNLGDSFYIFTASHVTEFLQTGKQLFVKTNTGYVSIVGEYNETILNKSDNVDLAFFRIDDVIVKDLINVYRFLPISKIRKHNKLLDAAQYCVVGFPEKNKRHEEGRLQTYASAFIVQPCNQKVYNYYGFKEDSSFILEIKGKGIDLKTGMVKKVKDNFHGLSGCGLWLLLIEKKGDIYSADYRLIGIMTEFRKDKFYCLIGNRVEIILQEIKDSGLVKYREIVIKEIT